MTELECVGDAAISSKCIPLLLDILDLMNTGLDAMDIALVREIYAVITHIVAGFVSVHVQPSHLSSHAEVVNVESVPVRSSSGDGVPSEGQAPLIAECESLALTTPKGSTPAAHADAFTSRGSGDLSLQLPSASSTIPGGQSGDGALQGAVSLLVSLALSIGQVTRFDKVNGPGTHDAQLVRDCLISLMHLLKAHPHLQETFLKDDR